MKFQSLFIVSIFLVALAAAAEALGIGFDIDTPLDPLLGGISKVKRHLLKRIKDLSTNENFVNACPADQIAMLLGQQQQQQPIVLPPIFLPGQFQQAPQLNFDQRKTSIPQSVIQQMDTQLANLNFPIPNVQSTKRTIPLPGLFDARQMPNVLQQTVQGIPLQLLNQFPGTQRQYRLN